mmetsp:Transcript_15331/g.30564  ORF Transcript_15331/g.30564 Transcript_15331/m.30564 type:complete len:127 (-) Transcript_15331:1732-2112(-)|eukprot:CAMPEP_0194330398 /NCGR_PEP_ID=MMETSP0171-20130528/51849_1 /TAXON_ID=218684 /ORGANISM="Corethron pennatum, Strain L29A3" /LENGTH=126 /DNA_ID=CAMNT_0039091483 /DNA_START=125 /DNA_END=505 /DNA_ORIENTATION=+
MEDIEACEKLKKTNVVKGRTVASAMEEGETSHRIWTNCVMEERTDGSIATSGAVGATKAHTLMRREVDSQIGGARALYASVSSSLGFHFSNDFSTVPSSLGLLTPPPLLLLEKKRSKTVHWTLAEV